MDVEKTMEFILEQLAHASAVQAKAEERQARTDKRLSRAIHLAVGEARQERKRRQELGWKVDEKITQLAAAQLITEEKLQRLIEERRSGNGRN
jgi:hypothetical protein